MHPNQEWSDHYRPANVNDLQRFFDRFLKGSGNNWEKDPPPVRLSLLGFEASGGLEPTIKERPEQEYPLARQRLKTYYIDASSRKLTSKPLTTAAKPSYAGHHLTVSAVRFFSREKHSVWR